MLFRPINLRREIADHIDDKQISIKGSAPLLSKMDERLVEMRFSIWTLRDLA